MRFSIFKIVNQEVNNPVITKSNRMNRKHLLSFSLLSLLLLYSQPAGLHIPGQELLHIPKELLLFVNLRV